MDPREIAFTTNAPHVSDDDLRQAMGIDGDALSFGCRTAADNVLVFKFVTPKGEHRPIALNVVVVRHLLERLQKHTALYPSSPTPQSGQ